MPFLGEELDKFLSQRFGEFGWMDQHSLLAWGRIVDEPRFLEFQPSLGVQIVEFVGRHLLIVIRKLVLSKAEAS